MSQDDEPPTGWRQRGKRVRVAVLLLVLVVVAAGRYATRARIVAWARPLVVAVIPVLADTSSKTSQYVSLVTAQTYAPVQAFLAAQAQSHGVALPNPVYVVAGKPIRSVPPVVPVGRGAWEVMAWSLRLRWWSWQANRGQPMSTVQIYVLYSDTSGRVLDASYGIKEALVGVVNTAADERAEDWTNLALTHELLHTLGATDKYLQGGYPAFPDGFAQPDREPRTPQDRCEIMAGQIPTSGETFFQAPSVGHCVVGPRTAREIGWK